MSKDKGTFQGYNIGEDCTACGVLFGVTTGWSHIENRISVKTFHVCGGLFPQASHNVLYRKILLGFLPLIPVARWSTLVLQTIESRVADQLHSCWFIHSCIEKTTFQLSWHIYLLKNHPAKADQWLENLNRQKWKPDNHIWSVCRNTDNDVWIWLCALLLSRQCVHENTKYGVQNFQNGPNSSSLLIL